MNARRIVSIGGGYPLAVCGVALVSLALLPFRAVLSAPTVMLLFVPVIIGVAMVGGVRPSAVAAILAFLALDLLFVPPYYHLTVASLSEWLGLVVFAIVALVSGLQAGRLRQREMLAVRRQEELALLNRLAFQIASEKSVGAVANFIVSQVTDVLGAARSSLYVGFATSEMPRRLAQAGLLRPSRGEAELVGWVLHSSKAVGMPEAHDVPYDQRVVSVGPADAVPGIVAEGVYLPLQTASSLEGVLFAEYPAQDGLTDEDARLLAAIANLAAASLERERLEEDASHAEALREADRLKSTLVSSVSHELKTPLAAATARVTGLLEGEETADAQRVTEELSAVAEDLSRLNDSIADLLDLSRLESDAWEPHFEPHDLRDILGTVLARLPKQLRDRLRFDIAEDLGDLNADYAQLARALSNVVENALAYSPPGAEVLVSARQDARGVRIAIEDTGPGVPDAEKSRVFEKFFRGEASANVPSGTGLGLAIAHEIVRTHRGTLTVEDVEPHGARFVMTLPPADKETA